jgi:hypothetical protein
MPEQAVTSNAPVVAMLWIQNLRRQEFICTHIRYHIGPVYNYKGYALLNDLANDHQSRGEKTYGTGNALQYSSPSQICLLLVVNLSGWRR